MITNKLIIPEKYKDADYKTLSEDLKNKHKESRKTENKKDGLYLFGDIGTGKTHALYAIRKVTPMPEYSQSPEYNYDKVLKMFDVFRDIKHTDWVKNPELTSSYMSLNDLRSHPYYIFLDDFGMDAENTERTAIMLSIVDYRCEHRLPTIFTSNLSLDEIAVKYDARIASRISEMCYTVEFQGNDKRMDVNIPIV